jgi:hypothetical protein
MKVQKHPFSEERYDRFKSLFNKMFEFYNELSDNSNSDHISDNTREKLYKIRMNLFIQMFTFLDDHTDILMYLSEFRQHVLIKINEFKQSENTTKELINIMDKVKNKLIFLN